MLRLNAFALATWSASDQLVLGGGALTGFSFGSLLALPAAYVEWKPSASWRLEAFVPARRQSIEVTLPAFSRAATAVALRTPSE